MNDSINEMSCLNITTEELRKIPKIHAGALVVMCLAINELNIMQKVLLLSENTRTMEIQNSELMTIAFTQTMILNRNLAAKIFEYRNMIKEYKKECDKVSDTSMQEFFDKAFPKINKLKSDPSFELARWYRNKVTNHFDVNAMVSLVESADLDETQKHPIYLLEPTGNCSYVLGEQILLAKLGAELSEVTDKQENYITWILEASEIVTSLHQEFCCVLVKKFIPGKSLEKIPIQPDKKLVGNIKESNLPIFLKVK